MEDKDENKKYFSIGEVCVMTGVKDYLLRQWEERFYQLSPKRLSTGRRVYTARDIEIVKRIKTLIHHDGLNTSGARIQLNREIAEVGRPRNKQEMLNHLDTIAEEARAILRLFDPDEEPESPRAQGARGYTIG